MPDVLLLSAVRTPLGAPHGVLAGWHPVELLAHALDAAVGAAGVTPDEVREVVAGCVEQVGGQANNVARAAVVRADWPATTGGSTIDRGPLSGLAALAHAVMLVETGAAPTAIAASIDLPSLVPAGAAAMGRHPFGRPWQGAGDARPLLPPAVAAERLGLSRATQDDWAAQSVARAEAARKGGRWDEEIVAVEARDEEGRAGDEQRSDELPSTRVASVDELAVMPPIFEADGTITAGNAAPAADGAVAVLVADANWASRHAKGDGLAIDAVQLRSAGTDDFATAAADAARAACARAALAPAAVSSVEVQEPFASVALAVIQSLGLDPSVVNPDGSALALGEPAGGSGLRALVTLAHRLRRDERPSGLVVASGVGAGAAVMLHRP
jgi:acetyl-CoA acyltransferase